MTRGAHVVASARRADALGQLAAAAPPGTLHPLPYDVTEEDAAARAVVRSAEMLGGLDVVVYAAGTATLGPLASTSFEEWRTVLGTNLIGAATTVAAALPFLREASAPTAVLLSSHSVGQPWPGLVAYAASKAGLDELARGLRAEEPWLRTVLVAVGNTATSFADAWDPDALVASTTRWIDEGYLRHDVLSAEEVAGRIVDAIGTPGSADDLAVIGPPFA